MISTKFDPSYKLKPAEDREALALAIKSKRDIIGRHRLNVQIQTTSVCNGKCLFCPYTGSWHEQNPGYMSVEVYTAILDNLRVFDVRKFCPYLENEPLADPKLFDRIEEARVKLNPEWIEVSSNLALLNESRLDNLVRVLCDGPHEILVSFHGADKIGYEEIMGLEFEKTMENIHRLISRAQSTSMNLVIRGAGVPKVDIEQKYRWFDEVDFRKFWEKELDGYQYKPLVSFFKYHDRADSPGLRERGMSFCRRGRNLSDFYCTRFDRWAHFLYTGEPILCCMDYFRETAFGARFPGADIGSLFTSERYLSMLRRESDKKTVPMILSANAVYHLEDDANLFVRVFHAFINCRYNG